MHTGQGRLSKSFAASDLLFDVRPLLLRNVFETWEVELVLSLTAARQRAPMKTVIGVRTLQ